jgi:hypothetical protein
LGGLRDFTRVGPEQIGKTFSFNFLSDLINVRFNLLDHGRVAEQISLEKRSTEHAQISESSPLVKPSKNPQ